MTERYVRNCTQRVMDHFSTFNLPYSQSLQKITTSYSEFSFLLLSRRIPFLYQLLNL